LAPALLRAAETTEGRLALREAALFFAGRDRVYAELTVSA
jgi:hypothetical protein